MRVTSKIGQNLPKRIKSMGGLDYPMTEVGKSAWKGSDGRPVVVGYDPSTRDSGKAVALYILAHIDELMTYCDRVFGVRGQGGNVIVCPDFGGAYHYGCDFQNGGDWYESLSGNGTTLGLVMAEVSESYMGLQSKGWNCGGSGGEALSRFLAEVATGGPSGDMRDYAAGPSWDGSDWISSDQGSDQDYPSIGCGVLYLWWLTSLGYTVDAIVQAGEPDRTLKSHYAALTQKPLAQAFSDFKAACRAIGAPGSYQNDNPFNAPNPPYPGSVVPPPPPPPPPVPTDGITVVLQNDTPAGTYQFHPAGPLQVPTPTDAQWQAILVILESSIPRVGRAPINFGKLLQIVVLVVSFLAAGPPTPASILALIEAIKAILASP